MIIPSSRDITGGGGGISDDSSSELSYVLRTSWSGDCCRLAASVSFPSYAPYTAQEPYPSTLSFPVKDDRDSPGGFTYFPPTSSYPPHSY